MAMELNRVHNMDCIEGMKKLEPASIDLAFADPPFNIGYKYDVYEDKRAADEYLDWTRAWGKALVNTLKPDGTFWLAIGDDFAAELKLIFQRELGLTCRSWVIWYYTFGVNCKFKFSRSHTHLFHFVRDPKKCTFNGADIRVPSARQLVYADARASEGGRLPDDTWVLRPQDLPEGFQPEEDVWHFPRVCGTFKERAGFHGCQMPEQLLGRIIKACSKVGELVLDPFGGSGTTLIVAKKLGRQFIGFELSQNYVHRIDQRLSQVQPLEGLSGSVNPQQSAPTTAEGRQRDRSPTRKGDTVRARVRATREETTRAILEAFLMVRDGWSADRVIADPDFNRAFLDTSRRLGVEGPDEEINRRLFALRKSAKLKGLPKSRKAVFPIPPDEQDHIEFALEIALQRFKKGRGQTLDDVLCDPKAAAEFDACVYSMIPKPYRPFVIRWLALRLRKRASKYRRAAAVLRRPIPKPNDGVSPFDLAELVKLPREPAIYWLWTPEKHLYVGSTLDLQGRLDCQFVGTHFDFWGASRADLRLAYAPRTEGIQVLRGQQSRLIKQWKPEGNYEEFAAAE